MPKVGGTHVRIHRPCLELHRRYRKLLIGKLGIRVLGKTLVHCPVDLLTHMAGKPLPAPATGGRQLLDSLLFETLAELGLAAALFPVTLLPLAEFAVKG